MAKGDAVNQPLHYNTGRIEAIDAAREIVTEDEFIAHCRLTAFKYIWRAPHKGNETQDIKKAIWYLRQSIGDDPREETNSE